MPTVQIPRYGPQKVSTAPVPGVRKSAYETPESLGVDATRERARTGLALAGVVEGGVSELTKILQQERDRADDVALLEAENRASAWRNNALFGEKGVMNTVGKDAMALPEYVSNEWKKTAGDIESGLTSDRQREKWRAYRQKAGLDLDLTVQRHVSEQRSRYQAEELKNGIDNTVSFALANSADLSVVGDQLKHGVALLETHGKQLGKGPETIQAETLSFTTRIHTGVISAMIDDGQSSQAQVYAEVVADQMDGDAQQKVAVAIQRGSKEEKIQAATERILGAYKTLEEQRAAAKKELSGDIENGVLQNLLHEHSLAQSRKREGEEEALDQAKAILDRSKRPRLTDIPEATRNLLIDAGHGEVLNDYLDKKLKGNPVDTDEGLYASLVAQMYSTDPDEQQAFIDTNLMALMGRLSTSDRRALQKEQLKMRAPGEAVEPKSATEGAISQMTAEALTSIGLDPTPPPPGSKKTAQSPGYSKEDTEAVNLFRRRVLTDVGLLEKPTCEQVQQLVDHHARILNQELTDTTSDVPLITRLQKLGSRNDIYLPNQPIRLDTIPGSDREAIEQRLRRAGKPVTPTEVIKMYREVLRLRAEGR
jgi:hypothetical protein